LAVQKPLYGGRISTSWALKKHYMKTNYEEPKDSNSAYYMHNTLSKHNRLQSINACYKCYSNISTNTSSDKNLHSDRRYFE